VPIAVLLRGMIKCCGSMHTLATGASCYDADQPGHSANCTNVVPLRRERKRQNYQFTQQRAMPIRAASRISFRGRWDGRTGVFDQVSLLPGDAARAAHHHPSFGGARRNSLAHTRTAPLLTSTVWCLVAEYASTFAANRQSWHGAAALMPQQRAPCAATQPHRRTPTRSTPGLDEISATTTRMSPPVLPPVLAFATLQTITNRCLPSCNDSMRVIRSTQRTRQGVRRKRQLHPRTKWLIVVMLGAHLLPAIAWCHHMALD